MDKTIIEGTAIQVRPSISDKNKRDNIGCTVHINNLSFAATEDDIISHFENHLGQNSIIRCVLVKDNEGNSKGFAYVVLSEEELVQQAIRLKDNAIKGRPVKIERSTRKITEKKDMEESFRKRKKSEKGREHKYKPKDIKRKNKKQKIDTTVPEAEPKAKEVVKMEKEAETNKETKEGITNEDFRRENGDREKGSKT